MFTNLSALEIEPALQKCEADTIPLSHRSATVRLSTFFISVLFLNEKVALYCTLRYTIIHTQAHNGIEIVPIQERFDAV